MTQEIPVPASKISPPRLSDCVAREALFARLDETEQTPLTWIAAPSGSGKTTAVAAWLAQRKNTPIWLRLDATDSDPAALFYFLGHAAKQANPRKRGSLPLFTLEYTGGLAAFSQSWLGQLCGYLKPPGVIVLDDYQNLADDSPFHAVLADWAGWLPEGIRILITSQAEPPEQFAKPRARRQLADIGWDQLRFSEEETRSLVTASLGDESDPALAEKLHRRCGGWASGMLLSMQGGDEDGTDIDISSPERVFEFFSAEILSQFTDTERTTLSRLALLPQCTAEMATAISGDDDAEALLRRMLKRGWFVSRHSGPDKRTSYRLHGLFRDFLLARLLEDADSATREELRKQAARLLERDGQADAAIGMLLDAGDIQAAIPLLLGNAMQLVSQGRFALLTGWLERIPDPMQDALPWLRFWRGVALLPTDPLQAYTHLAASHDGFTAAADPLGPWLAWVATVRAIKFSKQDFARMARWITAIDEFDLDALQALPPDIQAQVSTTVLDTLYMHQPDHPAFTFWAERAESQWQQIEDVDQFFLAAQILVNYLVFCGKPDRARLVLDALHRHPESAASPFARIVTIWAEGFYDWMTDRHAHCLELCDEGLALGGRHGIHLLDQNLLSHKVHALLPDGRVEEAQSCLELMRKGLPGGGGFDVAHYHYLQACLYLQLEDRGLARAHAEDALSASPALCSPLFAGMIHHAAAMVELLDKKPEQSRKRLAEAQSLATQANCPMLSWQCELVAASLDTGETNPALRSALSMAGDRQFFSHLFWVPAQMTALCEQALRESIEPETARELIRRRRLIPATIDTAPAGWPWPIRVGGFGGFELRLDGEPVPALGGRVLALLKTLYWLGGRQVPEARIAAKLWPDSEGDAAHHALENLLYRVRKTLADHGAPKDTVLLQDGQLGYNPDYCWLDLWAFHNLLTRIDQQITERAPADEVEHSALALLHLHQSPLLPEDDDSDIVAERQRLQDRLVRQILRAGKLIQESGESKAALMLYQMAVEAAPLAEDLYERLIRLYQQQGRTADATETYRQCRQRLLDELGVEPGAAVKAAISG